MSESENRPCKGTNILVNIRYPTPLNKVKYNLTGRLLCVKALFNQAVLRILFGSPIDEFLTWDMGRLL